MSLENELRERSKSSCELCSGSDDLQVYTIPPSTNEHLDNSVIVCRTCFDQIKSPEITNINHWRCLNDSMWSEHIPVQVVVWRLLFKLKKEGWPQDLLNMMYIEDATLEIAKSLMDIEDEKQEAIHRDVNGVVLSSGDSVILIKDLKVKGSSLIAKQGTPVRNIRLDRDNKNYIEGKVGPTQIVIITDFVKKI